MQQFIDLGDIRDIRRCDHQAMRKARFIVGANVGFRAEVVLVPLLCLMHLRVTLLPSLF
ncbi:hypothetical protein D3C71_2069930 [compost metagenome]